ncbi:MAG: SGNH/GDSL hydrolase family protein, partial [Chloroflexi bacterium]|nr:SGNH/GDSL hydrolase family protein [Chloroflexota bacterium]
DRWNQTIAEVVARHGAELVDLHADWRELAEHPEYVGRDGFHPSSEGYRRLADVFLNVLVQRTDIL